MEQAREWRVEFYRDDRGRSPVEEFIAQLDTAMQTKVFRALRLLRESGGQLPMPLARPLRGYGISELRVQTGGNHVRVFYFEFTGRRIILLHGFVKKSRRTPQRELDLALRRRSRFTEGG